MRTGFSGGAVTGRAMFDLRRLETLLVVARTGSFAGAADALHFTPSAVSQQMSTLERATGVKLFERSARGIELTQAGLALREHADVVLARLATAAVELEAIGGEASGRLRFGSFSSATGAFTARAFRLFAERFPDAETGFFDGEPFESLEAIAADELDLAVVFELDGWPAGSDYKGTNVVPEFRTNSVPLFDDPYLLILREKHPLAASETIALEQIGEEPLLVAAPWHRDLERAFRDAGLEPKFDPSCRGTGFEALQSLVSTGHGLTLMPRLALGWLRDGLTARPLEDAPVRHVKAVAPMGGGLPMVTAMVEILLEMTATLGLGGSASPTTADEGSFEPSASA